ncbi:hypothetical protein Dred_0957 [Desulforamulus reducens MI-1]|uniref:Uncharacterized protein n=1 Tax=Desulforamulus reducens (strain ATCC BAA-1160 / DSM 100696 / MI-1) TaxID=349161 RepID=A4J339_DESRM|nr:hypothetical protein [Desulforamulus reducens]ABO49492.1 hypothetical protein Dred_0957 [Desulforamulus reducens MI-1]
MRKTIKNFVNQVKEFWKDDRGTGADTHTTNFLYIVGGIAITSLIIGALGVIISNKTDGISSDIKSFKVTVPSATNGAGTLTNAAPASGNSTVNGITFNK